MSKTGITIALAGALLSVPAAQAVPVTFFTSLSGAAEAPPNASPGIGTAAIVIDTAANTLVIDAQWSGLIGSTTVAHIHCCTAAPGTGTIGIAVTPGTLPGFPAGVTAGTYHVELDLASLATYASAFVANFGGGTVGGAEVALFAGLQSGSAYFNIHSTAFPGGEIRGFARVPEPASLALLGLGLIGIGMARRRTA